jgi:hypothetical protein
MSTPEVKAPALTPLREQVEQSRAQAREQLQAAWQLHVERVEEQLRSGWREHLERLLEERFGELAATIEEAAAVSLKEASEAAAAGAAALAVRRLSEQLNQFTRRMRRSANQREWGEALLEAASGFAPRTAVFTLQGNLLRLERCQAGSLELETQLDEAPAFRSAAETLEPVTATATPGELSPLVAGVLGAATGARAHVFPVISRGRAVGMLYAEAEGDGVNSSALELLATFAGAVWESRSQSGQAASAGLIGIDGASGIWSGPQALDQNRHLKAQRFARVQVAEIRLYKSQMVKEGRAAGSLYSVLKEDIDRSREAYRQQFLMDSPEMSDYLHLELVRTLANDDPTLLGEDYPGPLA